MRDKDEQSRALADAHYGLEEGITQIFRITADAGVEDRPEEPIKLLEVNEFTIPSGIMPLYFGPVPERGVTFPSIIVEVTPDEFERIQDAELVLPEGWTIGSPFPKPVLASDE